MTGRHRGTLDNEPRRLPVVVPAAGGLALAVLLGVGGWTLVRSSGDCAGQVPLDVVAAPDIAPVLTRVGERLTADKARVGDRCIEVRVSAQAPASVAAVLAGNQAGTTPLPDVWVPDSTVWVDQARSGTAHRGALPAQTTSIASSPTVIAAPAPVARQLAGSGGLSWQRLLKEFDGEQPLKVGFPNPTRNTAGLAALLSVAQVTGTSPQARAQQAAIARTLSQGAADTVGQLFSQLPKAADPASLASSVAALPTTEQSVWKYNANKPAVPLVALYPDEGALRLDYPYVTLRDERDPARAQAAARYLAELRDPASGRELAGEGFRSPDGQAGSVLRTATGVDPKPPRGTDPPEPRAVATVLRSWQALSLTARMLVLIDVSGSMSTKVPGVNKSRLEVTASAAQQGLGLLSDATEVGVWTFSSQLVGNQDYRVLIPPGPLSQAVGDTLRRGAIANALTRLQPIPNGSTGLYDSIRAVHRIAVDGYEPDKVNSVLVYTDGKNSDPGGGISLDGLLAELRRDYNPKRPVPVFILAFGQDVDMAAAKRIAAATDGEAYNVNSVGDITAFFLDGIGRRTCRPNC